MSRFKSFLSGAAAAGCIALAPTIGLGQAGVVIQQKTTFNVAQVSNSDLQQTVSILGADRAKTVTTGKIKILIISKDASGSEIVRLDQGQVIKLDDKKKKYEIQTLAEQRAELAKQQKDAEKSATAKEKDNVRYYAVVDEARRTGEKQTINGFKTERISIKITVMGENTKTKQTAPYMHLISDIWMDPSQSEAGRIVTAFAQARQEALGIDPTMAGNPYAKWMKDLDGEMAKLSGFPIRSTITFELEVDSATAAANKDNKSGGDPMAALGGMFGKKKEQPAGSGSGRPVLFSMTSEVLSISMTAPGVAEFEIPAGYVKK